MTVYSTAEVRRVAGGVLVGFGAMALMGFAAYLFKEKSRDDDWAMLWGCLILTLVFVALGARAFRSVQFDGAAKLVRVRRLGVPVLLERKVPFEDFKRLAVGPYYIQRKYGQIERWRVSISGEDEWIPVKEDFGREKDAESYARALAAQLGPPFIVDV